MVEAFQGIGDSVRIALILKGNGSHGSRRLGVCKK